MLNELIEACALTESFIPVSCTMGATLIIVSATLGR